MNNKLGIFFTCFDEKKAVEFSLLELLKTYPDIPIYLVSDGGLDFSYLNNSIKNFNFELGEDTMSQLFKITGGDDGNFREPTNQKIIKKSVIAVIDRLKKCIDFCKSEYILMMDPDCLVRGELTIPNGVKLLGSRINSHLPIEYKHVLSKIEGAKVINNWGATPGIFHTESFLKSVAFLENNIQILDELSMAFYAICAHDLLLPTLFALIGEEETFNPDIIECFRDNNWRSKSNPLVHQFREHY